LPSGRLVPALCRDRRPLPRPRRSPLFPYPTLFRSFLPVVRTLTPAAAGTSKLPFRKFFPAAVAGAICWSALHIALGAAMGEAAKDRKSTRLNSSHVKTSYAVFCLRKDQYRKPHTAC